ncbi:hypothetical protein RND81_05G018000 [Saponaria officinalis]|uniref:Uncharacterized protein n=1 Tax=Saponaria officinalis TaxID=3572 RepID=A0AAW1KTD0_SAPOF
MCDQLEATYNLLNLEAKPIRLSKQYILNYISVLDDCMDEPFGRKIATTYLWAIANPLVLEEDYDHLFTRTRQLQRVVKCRSILKIEDFVEHSGDEQRLFEEAILKYPVAASMYVRKSEVEELWKNSSRPYFLHEDPGKEKYRKHAVVLFGMVSYGDDKEKLDSYLVKDSQYIVSNGRFFMKKYSSLLYNQYNPLRRVMYARKRSLDYMIV